MGYIGRGKLKINKWREKHRQTDRLQSTYSTDQKQGIMRLRFKRSATAFIASIDRGSASFEPW